MGKKLPFTKDQYNQMLDAKLGGQNAPVSAIDRIKQAISKIRPSGK